MSPRWPLVLLSTLALACGGRTPISDYGDAEALPPPSTTSTSGSTSGSTAQSPGDDEGGSIFDTIGICPPGPPPPNSECNSPGTICGYREQGNTGQVLCLTFSCTTGSWVLMTPGC